ncbi:MAG: hypothetical protein ACO306_05710 [Flavobacteriaceae bacterium]
MSNTSTDRVLTHRDLPVRGIEKFNVTFGDIREGIKENINDSILSCEVNYSMAMATEITLQIIDRDYSRTQYDPKGQSSFASANYFSIARDVTYMTKQIAKVSLDENSQVASVDLKSILMEVAEVSVSQEQGVSPIWTVKCRPKAVQQMKRDKKPEVITGNGSAYVQAACKKYGLECIFEKTDKSKKITKASGDNEADSVWDVIQNLAQQAKFKCFEVDGTLYFASMKWLLHKWGPDAIVYTATVKDRTKTPPIDVQRVVTKRYIPLIPGELGKAYELMKMPSMSKSDNAVMEATGSAEIERTNGVGIRPGMTVYVGGVPSFNGYYLVTSVNFEERSPNPVGINFETPERRPKEKIIGLPVGIIYPNTQNDDPIGPDVLIPYLKTRTTSPVNTGTRPRPT